MDAPEVCQFLTFLARQRKVSASTQNQALSALLFLYKKVLNKEIGFISDIHRAKSRNEFPLSFQGQRLQGFWAKLMANIGWLQPWCMVLAFAYWSAWGSESKTSISTINNWPSGAAKDRPNNHATSGHCESTQKVSSAKTQAPPEGLEQWQRERQNAYGA